jgi:hypothetical protein
VWAAQAWPGHGFVATGAGATCAGRKKLAQACIDGLVETARAAGRGVLIGRACRGVGRRVLVGEGLQWDVWRRVGPCGPPVRRKLTQRSSPTVCVHPLDNRPVFRDLGGGWDVHGHASSTGHEVECVRRLLNLSAFTQTPVQPAARYTMSSNSSHSTSTAPGVVSQPHVTMYERDGVEYVRASSGDRK